MSARRHLVRAVPAAVAVVALAGLAACSAEEPDLEVVSEGTVRTVADLGDLDAEGTVHAVALNEYSVDIPVSVADHDGAFLATLENGEPIAVEDGGPTRVVFTDDHPDTANETLWIWSLASLDVS